MPRLVAFLAALATIAGCGGRVDPASLPTRTPPAGVGASAGLDVRAVNAARNSMVSACEARAKTGAAASSATGMPAIRTAAGSLVATFRASPDRPFRRSPNTPAITMRKLLLSLALVARTRCGGPPAVAVGDRLAKVAARHGG